MRDVQVLRYDEDDISCIEGLKVERHFMHRSKQHVETLLSSLLIFDFFFIFLISKYVKTCNRLARCFSEMYNNARCSDSSLQLCLSSYEI